MNFYLVLCCPRMSEFVRTFKRFISNLGLYCVCVKREHSIHYIIMKFGLYYVIHERFGNPTQRTSQLSRNLDVSGSVLGLVGFHGFPQPFDTSSGTELRICHSRFRIVFYSSFTTILMFDWSQLESVVKWACERIRHALPFLYMSAPARSTARVSYLDNWREDAHKM